MNVEASFSRQFKVGLLLCILLSVLGVLCRGVRWDESYEHAQVLTETVSYPAGHPLQTYVQSPKSIQLVVTSWLLEWTASPAWVNGFRNFLFLLSTILPVYLFTMILCRNLWLALLAVALTLQGVFLEFDGSYPLQLWPELYSNGHIGIGMAGIALYLWIAGRHGWAGFSFALLGAIHIGQLPPLMGTVGVGLLLLLFRGQRMPVLNFVIGTTFGLTLSVCMFLSVKTVSVTEIGGFTSWFSDLSQDDAQAIWQRFTLTMDPHRRMPMTNGHLILLGTSVLAIAGLWTENGEVLKKLYGGICLYLFFAASIIYGTMLVHSILQEHTPFIIIGWMPYRLINHCPALLCALMIGILSRTPTGRLLVLGAVLWGVLHPWLGSYVPASVYSRYLAGGEAVVFGLWGAALLGLAYGRNTEKQHLKIWILFTLAILLTASFHQFGACCLLLGGVGYVLLFKIIQSKPEFSFILQPAQILLCIIALSLILFQQIQHRQHLPQSTMEKAIAGVVEAAPVSPLILAPPDSFMLQARTGTGVFIDAATASFVSYDKALGPGINQMLGDAFGSAYTILPGNVEAGATWQSHWTKQSPEDWAVLGAKYDITHVLAPKNLDLPLEQVLVVGDMQLNAL